MAYANNFIALLFLLIFSHTFVQSDEEGHIKLEISNKGLDFLNNLLIKEAESSFVPLELPKIEKSVKIPIVGKVKMVLSNITIERIHVTNSTVKTGDTGIVIAVSGASANLTMKWKYSYSTWLLPISISDEGSATVEVEGMEIGLTLSMKTLQGSLKLSLLESGCYVKAISIDLYGGASWLYQGLVDAFKGKISSAVEDAMSKKIEDGIINLDSLLESLPKEVPINDIAALNVTFIDDPELTESSLDLEINGLFSAKNEVVVSNQYHRMLGASSSCKTANRMVRISLHEDVLKSASSVYFEAGKMHWIVDKVPDQSLLNTAEWRFIVPQLYKLYPNDNIILNISVSSPPIIKIGNQQIHSTIPLDMVLDVLDADKVIPVACISMSISASIYAEISQNGLTGIVKLNDFTVSLQWSKIGDLHMHLIKAVMSTTLKALIVPYVNLQLWKGFHLPSFHGYKLQNAQIFCTDSWIFICSDLVST
ncbi:putative BPI/LBP family protein [Forsythia ovata]|uniref:BPI/LBP family protein n=1 Tax=Forsythia ovata TaxID=205694 RepID=A0ABD1S595_9LAMI